MPVEVQVGAADARLPAAEVVSGWVDTVCAGLPDDGAGDVCVRFVDEAESRQLNDRYRGKNKATNVLSFPADLPDDYPGERVLGDIVICTAVVAAEAMDQSKVFTDHLAHMVVHGMLHLYGYDHEADAAARRQMEGLEREILDRLGIDDPYRER